VTFLKADHATAAGNRRLAEQVRAAFPDLNGLVNNVGGLYPTRWETTDGYEATLAMNFVGPLAGEGRPAGRLPGQLAAGRQGHRAVLRRQADAEPPLGPGAGPGATAAGLAGGLPAGRGCRQGIDRDRGTQVAGERCPGPWDSAAGACSCSRC
jgi:hypothetical protein